MAKKRQKTPIQNNKTQTTKKPLLENAPLEPDQNQYIKQLNQKRNLINSLPGSFERLRTINDPRLNSQQQTSPTPQRPITPLQQQLPEPTLAQEDINQTPKAGVPLSEIDPWATTAGQIGGSQPGVPEDNDLNKQILQDAQKQLQQQDTKSPWQGPISKNLPPPPQTQQQQQQTKQQQQQQSKDDKITGDSIGVGTIGQIIGGIAGVANQMSMKDEYDPYQLDRIKRIQNIREGDLGNLFNQRDSLGYNTSEQIAEANAVQQYASQAAGQDVAGQLQARGLSKGDVSAPAASALAVAAAKTGALQQGAQMKQQALQNEIVQRNYLNQGINQAAEGIQRTEYDTTDHRKRHKVDYLAAIMKGQDFIAKLKDLNASKPNDILLSQSK